LSAMEGRVFVVDIEDLTAVDEAGGELLLRWRSQGAQFLATSKRARSLAESVLGYSLPVEPRTREAVAFGAFRFALSSSVVLLALLLPIPVLAADSPSVVLDRYYATLENSSDSSETGSATLDIEASLPKLAKQARLQAIRRPVPFSKPEYEVLQIAGDAMVRRQVIARYLSADAEGRS